jgi:pimeloyl-ACP methyl ester carboxylesterase
MKNPNIQHRAITVLIIIASVVILLLGGMLYLGIRPYTPSWPDATSAAEEGIAELQPIQINGSKQWLLIRGADRSKPLLLWLHGGPGAAKMPLAHALPSELEKHFVVVHWDQRGAGKSNTRDLDEQTLHPEQFLDDALDVIGYLLASLDQEQIWLLGHSWGTRLGIELIQRHPELFHGYIGVSQVADHRKAVELATMVLRKNLNETENHQALRKLERLNNPTLYHADYRTLVGMISAHCAENEPSTLELARVALKAPEYCFRDYFKLWRGVQRGGKPMHHNGIMEPFSYLEDTIHTTVPVYFITGRHDLNTPLKLTRQLFQQINAPEKELIVFENSGHLPFFTEKERFAQELIRIAGTRGE